MIQRQGKRFSGKALMNGQRTGYGINFNPRVTGYGSMTAPNGSWFSRLCRRWSMWNGQGRAGGLRGMGGRCGRRGGRGSRFGLYW